jgi:hypothetical protein
VHVVGVVAFPPLTGRLPLRTTSRHGHRLLSVQLATCPLATDLRRSDRSEFGSEPTVWGHTCVCTPLVWDDAASAVEATAGDM